MRDSFLAARYRQNLAGVAVLLAAGVAGGMFISNSYHLSILIMAGNHAIAALGLFVLFGLAGQISIGHAAFYGLGAYIVSVGASRYGLPPLAGLAAGTLVPAALGWLIARPLLRLEAHYLAMGTLAFGMIAFILFGQMSGLTGGLDPGIISTPSLSVFGIRLRGTWANYHLMLAALCLTMLAVLALCNSRMGRALRALRGSEIAAASLGVDVVRAKVAAFAFSAGCAGLAGALFALWQGSFNATSFGVGLSIELLVIVVVGGLVSPWGALFGALFLAILPSLIENLEQYKLLIYGTILTLVLIFLPDGLGRPLSGLVARFLPEGKRP